MDAHATTADPHRARPPEGGTYYAKVGLVLFILTALEVGLYEITTASMPVRLATSIGRVRPGPAAALVRQVRAGGDVLHAPEAGQPALRRGVRLPAHHRRHRIIVALSSCWPTTWRSPESG